MCGVRLHVCRGVYEPSDDSELLLEAMAKAELAEPVIDVGPGTGIEAICAARRGVEVVAIDISWKACLNTLLNTHNSPRIHVVQGDVLTPLRGNSCGTAVFNTPYLPLEDKIPGAEAWSGGERGVKQALEFIEWAARIGCRQMIIVTSTTADLKSIIREAGRRGYEVSVIASKHVFFETIMALLLRRQQDK